MSKITEGGKWALARESGHLNQLSTQFQHDIESAIPTPCESLYPWLTDSIISATDCLLLTVIFFTLPLQGSNNGKNFEILLHFLRAPKFSTKNSQKEYRLHVNQRVHWGLKLKGHIVWNGPHSHLGTITETYKLQNWDGWLLYPWKQMLAWPKCFIMIMINHPWNHCYLLVYNWWDHVGRAILYSFTNFLLLELALWP